MRPTSVIRAAPALLLFAAILVPWAGAAGDEPFCVEGFVCPETVACLPGVYCQATPCDPANDCRARGGAGETCEQNATIGGETCAFRISLAGGAGGRNVAVPGTYLVPGAPVPGTSVPTPGSSAEVEADLTRGFVHDQNLPNDWLSHAVRVRLVAAGLDLGETGVGIYQSSITAPGGEDNETRMQESHVFTSARLVLRHEGPVARTSASLGVLLLDAAPEDCDARAGQNEDVRARCSSTLPALP